MNKTFNPCNECGHSFLKRNQASRACGICEFKRALQDVKTLSSMYEKLSDKEVLEYHMLEEYKGLEEQGKLLKLPCKAGQKVHLLRKDIKTVIDGEVISFDIGEFAKDMRVYITDDNRYTNISFDKVGNIVFFTREEAGAALKELEGIEKNEQI